MDISAIPAPATASAGEPATGSPTSVAGDAFSSVFAAAMGDASTGVGNMVTAVPAQGDIAVPPLVVPAVSSPTPNLAVDAVPMAGVPEVAPPEAAVTPTAVEVQPDEAESPPAGKAARPKTRTPIPPEPPPRVVQSDRPEKEAPTSAPNAPVPPLDRSSEVKALDDDTTDEAPDLASPFVVPTTVTALAVTVAMPDAKAEPEIGDAGGRITATTVDAVLLPPIAPAKADGPRLQAAPDLGIVPQVVPPAAPIPAAISSPTAPPEKIANDRVAQVAAPATASVVEKLQVPSTKTFVKEVAMVEIATAATETKGDDAPSEDAPKDGATPMPAPEGAKSAATERPEAGTERPSVDRHLVVRQVADRIESLAAARPKDGVTIHLEPRDLGTVTLVVKGLASALDVQVTATDDRVRQSLGASRPELAQALAPRGIELRELRVATAPTASGNASNSNPDGKPGSNPEGRPRPQTPSQGFAKPTRASTPTHRAARLSGRGVDVLV